MFKIINFLILKFRSWFISGVFAQVGWNGFVNQCLLIQSMLFCFLFFVTLFLNFNINNGLFKHLFVMFMDFHVYHWPVFR